LCYLVKNNLDNIVGGTDLMTATTTTFHCHPSRIPTSAGQRDVGATGHTKEIIHYYLTECRIRHEFDLWTRSFRPAVEYAVSRMNIGM
jgi:hypothetical protein